MDDANKYTSEDERWEYLITSMILGDQFVHQFVMMMSKHREEAIKTMGVLVEGARVKLFYAPKFLAKLTDSEARWVLVHEILHLVFHHCTVRASTDKRLHELDNIAADLAINQLIPNNGFLMKPRPAVIKPYFPESLGFDKMLSKEQYFQLLLKKENEDKQNGGNGQPQQGQGNGSSQPDNSIDNAGDLVDNHEGWSDAEGEIIDELIRNKVEQLSKSSKAWGKITGNIKEMILAAQKAQIAWWRYLREYLGLFSTTKTTSTLKRPNRRYGYPFPGLKRRHVDKILCAIDSSGSISAESLKKFLAEVRVMTETHPVDLIVFDDGITQGPMPFPKRKRQFEFKGRGGTNFAPVMELASKKMYKCLVVLTDGCAAACEYPKGVKDVIWCLVDDGKPPVDWGRQVHIKEKVGYKKAA